LRAPRIVEALLLTAVLGSAGARAQDREDVPPPPRILDVPVDRAEPRAPPATIARRPDSTRLAPLPDERVTDEIVVFGDGGWRLPDLGSAWRAEQEARDRGGQRLTWLPLYDPDDPPRAADNPRLSPEQQRLGFIELFRFRVGRRRGSDE
jgi:hypothetical protein